MSSTAEDSDHHVSPRLVFWLFLVLLGLGVASARAPWGAAHGLMFSAAGLLMVIFPPAARLPRGWWLCAAAAALAMLGVFLPSAWFGHSPWRATLETLGVETGSLVAVQPAAALELTLAFWMTLSVALWLLGHRPSSGGLRVAALAFTLGVSFLTLLALMFPSISTNPTREASFGFFPNRNHNATLMIMGTIVGLGCLTQAIRERRRITLALAVPCTIFLLWAVLGWSLSRAGVILLILGALLWLGLLGPRYLGSHARHALILLGLAAAGGFLIAEPSVKGRLDATLASHQSNKLEMLDFRLSTWRDTLAMVAQHPWTGVGAGQFTHVFPQFRKHTASAQHSQQVHPESDWLWSAAELGLPATILLAALTGLVLCRATAGLGEGRSRALRAACLVAAAVVAAHGLLDVPGHRVPIAWSAALMLGLAMRPTSIARTPHPWIARCAGLPVLGFGIWLACLQLGSQTSPACEVANQAVTAAMAHYYADQQALASGEPAPIGPDNDPLRQAIALLDHAQTAMPLDPRLYRLQGVLALHFQGLDERVERAFAIERALDPTCIEIPIKQAEAWAPVDYQNAARLIRLARQQAATADKAGVPAPEGFPSWMAAAESLAKPILREHPPLATALTLE